LPAINIEAWVGGVLERQVRIGRPLYINAILIQSRGSLNITVSNLYYSYEAES
jgi:hypothetical protein